MDRLEVEGALGAKLSVRIDRPDGPHSAVALFVHCFTCGKDIFAARDIARQLAAEGFACARFDFTGLGSSEGEFASTDFSSNVGDILKVVDALRDTLGAPQLLIGHSLGGAAVLVAARAVKEVRAVATIAAPADAAHVKKTLDADLARIESEGQASVRLGDRAFTIRREFIDDLDRHSVTDAVAGLKAALLVLHAPRDSVVGIENATEIFLAAKHPKSFVSLDDADHLLSNHDDARYAAEVIAAWALRYVEAPARPMRRLEEEAVRMGALATSAGGAFRTEIALSGHSLVADEPKDVGGEGSGPTPYDLLAAGLAACTLMTMRLYGARKGWTVDATVSVDHGKVHKEDCDDCADGRAGKDGRIDRFERHIHFGPGTDPGHRARLLEIADRCPVHKTLELGAVVVTKAQP
ncbi:bifunctional alpha/beta hydrolase/OsmC family protein [Acuticoccus kandeliae]|uniref:bifunctional alpha/beta hydrolase/OsmC family protein n=1 Tax=Acuticoccus kandeliae TaxID=2073160 RepID=UPI000D3E190A|nr:alpha/beta fold hydrolase [Acuticoccus kandeliae]